ncbi:MAG: T9SS type A sorting domain-containing protein [Parvicellaceae bacterium]
MKRMKSILVFSLLILEGTCFSQIWDQKGLTIQGESANSLSGNSVSLSADGNRIAIGARHNTNASGTSAGHTRVYEWNGSSWTQLGNDIDGEAAGDLSGRVVSISHDGSIVAIGAYRNDGNGNRSGHVRIYNWDGLSWNQMGADIDGEHPNDNSSSGSFNRARGMSLSGSGTRVAIGAFRNDDGGTNAGHVRIFEWNGNAWNQMGTDLDGANVGDEFGGSVSMNTNGDILVVGIPGDSTLAASGGATEVYYWNGLNWIQKGTTLYGIYSLGELGAVVGSNDNGDIIGTSAPQTNGSGTGRGAIYIYKWNGTDWDQLGNTIFGAIDNENLGRDFELSSDGETLIAASYGFEFKVFEHSSTNNLWTQKGNTIIVTLQVYENGTHVSIDSSGNVVGCGSETGMNGEGNTLIFEYDNQFVGIEEMHSQLLVNIFPNPTSNFISINSYDASIITDLELTDLNGKTIQSSGGLNAQKVNMNLNCSSGTYFIKVFLEDGRIIVKKIVLN